MERALLKTFYHCVDHQNPSGVCLTQHCPFRISLQTYTSTFQTWLHAKMTWELDYNQIVGLSLQESLNSAWEEPWKLKSQRTLYPSRQRQIWEPGKDDTGMCLCVFWAQIPACWNAHVFGSLVYSFRSLHIQTCSWKTRKQVFLTRSKHSLAGLDQGSDCTP